MAITLTGANVGGAWYPLFRGAVPADPTSSYYRLYAKSAATGVFIRDSGGGETQLVITSTGLSNINLSAGTTSQNLSQAVFSNSNNVSFGLNGSTVTASATVGSTQGSINLSAGTTSNLASAFTFSNSNGVSFGLNASTITGSVATSLTNVRISAGTTSNLLSALTFSNANGVSFGLDASTLTGSVATSLTNIRISAGTTSNLLSAITFANSNGISFGLNASTVTGSHNGITSQSNQQMTMFATGNTTQSSTGTTNASSLIFRGEGVASVGITGGSVVVSVPAGGGGLTNIRVSAGTTSNLLSDVTFADSNGVTFGLNASTITASVAAAGGGATMSHWPPYPMAMAVSSQNTGTTASTGGSTQTTASFHIWPLRLEQALSYSRLDMLISYNTVGGTGSLSLAYMLGIYTLNGGTRFDSLSTFFFRHEISQNSITAQSHRWYWGTNSTSNSNSTGGNISSLVTGPRRVSFYGTGASLAASQYWLVFGQVNRTSNSNIMPANSVQCISQYGTQVGGELGSAASRPLAPRLGDFSTTTNTNVLTAPCMPATIHTSVISQTSGSAAYKWPFVAFCATTN